MAIHLVSTKRNPGATPERVVLLAEKGGGVRPGSLRAIGNKRTDYHDQAIPGLILRVSPSGSRTFCIWYRFAGEARRVTVGKYPKPITLARARAEASRILDAARAGRDERDARAQAKVDRARRRDEARREKLMGGTVAKMTDDFLALGRTKRGRPLTPGTIDFYTRIFKSTWVKPIMKADPRKVTRGEIVAVLDKLRAAGHEVTRNRTLAALARVFMWGIETDRLTATPCIGLKQSDAVPRERVYSTDELRRIVGAFRDTEHEHLFMLALYAGCRPGEVRRTEWRYVDLDAKTLTIPTTKQNKSHTLPLSEGMLRVLDAVQPDKAKREGRIFPDAEEQIPSPFIRDLSVRAGVLLEVGTKDKPKKEGFRFQDLRRTVRTNLSSPRRASRGRRADHRSLPGEAGADLRQARPLAGDEGRPRGLVTAPRRDPGVAHVVRVSRTNPRPKVLEAAIDRTGRGSQLAARKRAFTLGPRTIPLGPVSQPSCGNVLS